MATTEEEIIDLVRETRIDWAATPQNVMGPESGVIKSQGDLEAYQQRERDLERMSRERLLPDEKTLEKVARYEAHLSRGLFKALHEMEALQVRRKGGTAPLARLDVDGLAGS